MPIPTFLSATGLILITELGDKTMLTAMCFSAQYRKPIAVLAATLLALAASTSIAVVIGVVLSIALPIDILFIVSALLFIGLGLVSIMKSSSEEAGICEEPKTFLSMVSVILFSELGDKSQLTILALSVHSAYPILILIGAIMGFVIVNLIGVYSGDWIASHVSTSTVKRVSGLVFIIFGVIVLIGII